MPEKPGFLSYEGFPYPLLALGQTIPRGYQYQSQMTPYKRDAKGDWGRALNESIDQFFTMWPQYMQQRRQFALQRDQLARQRAADAHQAKLRPYELKQAEATQQLSERRMQMLKNYPQMVENLPVPEKYKSYLKTLPPTEGLKMMQGFMTQMMKPRTKVLQPGEKGNDFNVPINVGPGGKVTPINVPVELQTLEVGDPNNPYKVKAQFNPQTKKVTPLNVTQELQTLPVGHADNVYNVPIQKHPLTGKITPIDVPQELITVQPGGIFPDGTTNEGQTPIQYNTVTKKRIAYAGTAIPDKYVPVPEGDSRLDAYPEPLHQYLHINKKNNQISFHPSFTREMQQLVLKEARPSATQRFSKWLKVQGNQVQSFADLEPWTGTSQESKLWFATQNLPPDHPLHIDAQNQLNLKHVKVTPNAIIVGRGYKDPSKPYAAKRLPEPTTEKIETGNSVSALAKKHGTTESQIIAANPDWFDKDMNGKVDTGSMRTSEQMGGAEMIIPTGKSKLSQSQINEAHSSRRRARVTEMPYATIIPIQTATVGDGLRLNTERLDMQNIQKSVKDFVELMQNPKARGFGKIGEKEKGKLEGIRQRLINNVQVLRDYGVLSPSEIENIERSVPAVNSIIALMTRGLGSDKFVVGAMNTLYQEAVNNERKLDALLKLYGAPVTDYERYEGGIPGFDATSGGSEIEILDNELNTFR